MRFLFEKCFHFKIFAKQVMWQAKWMYIIVSGFKYSVFTIYEIFKMCAVS